MLYSKEKYLIEINLISNDFFYALFLGWLVLFIFWIFISGLIVKIQNPDEKTSNLTAI